MKHLFLLSLFAFLTIGARDSWAAMDDRNEVLVVASYNIGEQWTDSILAELRSVLMPVNACLHIETMDARNRRGADFHAKLEAYLTSKYADMPLKLVILLDNAAFDFFMPFRARFQPDLPVVFCGLNNFTPAMLDGLRNVTGVNEELDIVGTVNLALRLFPRARHAAVVGGADGIGALNLENFRKAASGFARPLEVRELLDLHKDDVPQALATLPEDAIVFRMDNLLEQENVNVPLEESIEILARHHRLPVFSFWDFDVGHGALGGVVINGVAQGSVAGKLAFSILQGQSAEDLPVVMHSPNVPMFDYPRMVQFSLLKKDLPPGSVLVGEPVTFYTENKSVIWLATGVFAFMGASIIALIMLLLSRRKVELSLRSSEERNRMYVESAPLGIFILDRQRHIVEVNQEASSLAGYPPHELLTKRLEDVLAPECAEQGSDQLNQVFAQGRTSVELRVIRKNGDARWWTLAATRLSSERLIAFVADVTERREHEQSRYIFLELLDNAEHVVVFKDTSLRYLMINRAYTTLTGKTLQDVIGKTDRENFAGISTPEQIEEYIEYDKQALTLQQGQSITAEETTLAHDGSTRTYLTKKFPVFSKDATLLGSGVMAWEITQMKKQQETIQRSAEMLKTVMDAIPADIYVMDPETYAILFINKRMQERFKPVSVEAPCWRVFRDSPGPCGACPLTQLLAEDGPATIAWEDANPITGETFVNLDTMIHWVDGRRVKLQVATDVTALRNIEMALADSNSRLALALEVTSDALWDWRLDTDEVYYSPRWYAMLGYEPYELPSTYETWRALLHPDDLQAVEPVMQQYLKSGAPYELEFRMRTKSGGYRWILSRGKVVTQNSDGSALRMLGTHMDITERKRSAEELIAAKDKAESANKTKSEFLANMSHEIRTPLNGILGMLQLLQTTALDQEQQEYAEASIQSCKRLTRLLADILDLARVEAGRMTINLAEINLAETIQQVAELFIPVSRQSGVALHIHVHDGIPETLLGDATRLQQVLTNIIGNALKFTLEGEVRLEVYPLPGRAADQIGVLFVVEDTGIGISAADLDSLFDPFTQISQGYTRTHQGAGLGLSISRKLVSLMGGSIEIDSEVGKGSVVMFCVTLSRANGRDAVAAIAPEPPLPVQARLHEILLAEDDAATRHATRKYLEKNGCRVALASDGREALRLLASTPFDLVLMDVQMPVMDGVETTRRIRAGEAGDSRTGVPIVAMTAYAMAGDRERLLAAGMDDYVAKPVEFQTLREVILKFLA